MIPRKPRHTERGNGRFRSERRQVAVVQDGNRFITSASVLQVNRSRHTGQCAPCQCHILQPAVEFTADQIGIYQRAQGSWKIDRLRGANRLVGIEPCPVQDVGSVDGQLVPMLQTVRGARAGTCSRRGCGPRVQVAEHDILRIVVVQKDVFSPFAHRKLSALGREVLFRARAVLVVHECRDAGGRIGAKAFVLAAELLRPVFLPSLAVIPFPNAFPVGLDVYPYTQRVAVMVVAQILATAGQEYGAAYSCHQNRLFPVHRAPPSRFWFQSRHTSANLSFTGPK